MWAKRSSKELLHSLKYQWALGREALEIVSTSSSWQGQENYASTKRRSDKIKSGARCNHPWSSFRRRKRTNHLYATMFSLGIVMLFWLVDSQFEWRNLGFKFIPFCKLISWKHFKTVVWVLVTDLVSSNCV